MGQLAESFYVGFLNQTRTHIRLLPDPNGIRTLPSTTSAKWAVLCILSTQVLLSLDDIVRLLYGLSYRRSKSILRKGLARCVKFGLIEVTGRKKYKYWRLTQLGRQALNPKNMMKPTTADKVHEILIRATQWLAVSDLHDLIPGRSRSTIRRALKEEGTHVNSTNLMMVGGTVKATFKGMKIPGDRYGRYQWALAVADTTNWANATAKVAAPKPSKKSKSSASAGGAVVSLNPRYQGIPMCLPATTAAKLSLIKAVGDLVTTEFLPAQKKFSAHEVTKRLRELVFVLGDIKDTTHVKLVDHAETGTVWVKGRQIPKVEHEDVKHIVHELFSTGQLAGFDRIHTGQFFEYDLAANIVATQIATQQAVTPVVPSLDPLAPDPTVVVGQDGGSYDGSSTI